MEIIDIIFKILEFLGIFKSENCKTPFDTYSNLIYRIVVRFFPHFLLGWQIARLLFQQLSFEEYTKDLLLIIGVANHIFKSSIIMIKQKQLKKLKKMNDSFTEELESEEEEDIHKRNCHFTKL